MSEHFFADKLTFAIFPEDVPNPHFIIRRKGGVKAVRGYGKELELFALVLADQLRPQNPTLAQRRSIQQLVRIALFNNSLCEITFKRAISPWSEDYLHQADYYHQPLFDMMWEPHTHFKKYFVRQRPLHPVIREKRGI